ncbi:sigma-54-dependent transcriptional regulator [Thiohalorhabdus sp. Cl-TMA]|uniref:Sigma-54-dependent transcriptional regulator n=1 Tax=Thiohalorhabdus methylotrophus TaxID=3242694 RepID=A0ABV4TUT5_9GAMM
MAERTILIVEDERNLRRVMAAWVEGEGFRTRTAEDAEEALAQFARHGADLVVTDHRLGGDRNGLDLMHALKAEHPDLPVIIVTAYGNVEHAVEAMKAGADHYLTKPVEEADLVALVRNLLNRSGHALPTQYPEQDYGIVGNSPPIRELLHTIELVAPAPSTVQITGESGTGKELVARALHTASPRSREPFVAVNCAALPGELIESELFGYEKGAFTGAHQARPGKFEEAGKGTLFLDEVGEMPLAMQVKLLRALQEREITRLGSHRALPVNARLVTATNRDLARDAEEGRFREDLYYRLNVIPLHLPPLRERMEDIPLLARHFLERFAHQLGRNPPVLTAEALSVLQAYPWPGNIRELENILERTVVMTQGDTMGSEDLPHELSRPPAASAKADFPTHHLPTIERQVVIDAMEKTNWNQSQAAVLLGISRKQLRTKMKNLGLLGSDGEEEPEGAPDPSAPS